MTAIDPYRTLGLTSGASQEEIKRAYRHLAKLYHPDSAGDRALGRFLAIQAAYEALVDERGRGRGYRRPGPNSRPPAPPSAPWQADASRARATREANRARTRRAGPTPGPTSGGPGGPAPGTAGAAGAPGSANRRGPDTDGPEAAGRPAGSASAKGPGGSAGGTAGGADGGATGDGSTAGASTGRRSRRNRGPKATIGSTSYDGADKEPFDPAWEGATWYGAGSGTYWTLNPKEYADPRKHGPEYLARSRRIDRGSAAGPSAGSGAEASARPSSEAPAEAPVEAAREAADASPGPTGATPGPTPSAAPRADAGAGPPRPAPAPTSRPAADRAGAARAGDVRWADAAGPARPAAAGAAAAGMATAGPPRPRLAQPADVPAATAVARAATTLPGRILAAIVGWIPIGVALAVVSDVMPACSGSSLVCADPLKAGIWPIHLLIIGLLAGIPRLGLIAAYGSAAFLFVGLMATPVLIALGGAQTPDGTASALRIVLVAAWLGGIGIALSGRVELPPWRTRRVR